MSTPAFTYIPSIRSQLSMSIPDAEIFASQSISLLDLRTTNLSREPARQNSNLHSHQRWQDARGQYTRHSDTRSWQLLITDRDFANFAPWFTLHQAKTFFVIRGKSNLPCRRDYSRAVNNSTGLRCDQTIVLIAPKACKDYPQNLRLIKLFDAEHDKGLVFLTNL